jgi:hypothetical protein
MAMTDRVTDVRRAASWLIGMTLREPDRTLEMEMFEFGPDVEIHPRRGGPKLVPRFGIHAQCPWRIVRDGQIAVAYSDYDSPDPADPNMAPWAFRDTQMRTFHAAVTRTVAGVDVSDLGDLKVRLSDGSFIELYVDQSRGDQECYRVHDVLGDHVVVMGGPNVTVTPRRQGPPSALHVR